MRRCDRDAAPPGGQLWLLVGMLVVVSLAGCIDGAEEPLDASSQDDGLGLLGTAIDQAAWDDPSQAPHPAFGWPTPTHVPASAPSLWQPIPERTLPETIGSIEPLAEITAGAGGERVAIFGELVVVPTPRAEGEPSLSGPPQDASYPVTVLSLREPLKPQVLSTFEPGMATVDAGLIATPEGRLVAVLATTAGLMPVWDVTDPTEPRELTVLDHGGSGHNVGVVPGTPIVYVAGVLGGGQAGNAPSLASGTNLIIDLSVPEAPELVAEWENGYGCHTVGFHLDAGGQRQRAYCAGYEATQIWDIEDPASPEVITTMPVHHGQPGTPSLGVAVAGFTSTMTYTNQDGTTLVVSDEDGIIVPACEAHAEPAGRSVSSPRGALWFYDITDEGAPVLQGYIAPGGHALDNEPPPQPLFTPADLGHCAAHYATLIPDPDRDLLAVAFWQGGVGLIDFTDPANPSMLDRWKKDAITTDVHYASGHLVAAHWDAGLDVLGLASG